MLNGKRVIGIIPARAGSKGVKGKNFRSIYGRPLIDWSINASVYSSIIDTTVVSTNCPHVESCCKTNVAFSRWHYWGDSPNGKANLKFHLYCVPRPEELCTDEAPTEPAMIHAIDYMKEEHGVEYGYAVLLQPTSPARPSGLIDRCLKKMEEGFNSVMTVSSHTPFFWRVRAGQAIPDYDPNNRPRRQDIPDEDIMYHDNGNLYAVSVDNLRRKGRIGDNPCLYETTHFESLQIDIEDDFVMLESLAQHYGGFL